MIQQPDLLNQLIIPLAADLVSFTIKVGITTFFVTFFFKRYITPYLKKKDQDG
jgi:hypothetical protein